MNVLPRFRVVSAGFAIGALVHGIELTSRLFASWRPDYPLWRHALFIVIDASLAALALVAPERLWLPLATLLLQQSSTHGRAVWIAWSHEHRIAWIDALVVAFIAASTLVAFQYRRRRDTLTPAKVY